MSRRIALIQGHPDPAGGHFCHALADAYARAATDAGHMVRRIEVATLAFDWLTSEEAFESAIAPGPLQAAQDDIHWATHLVIVHPLWLGMMPARLKAFFEQILRPGFAHRVAPGRFPQALLGGRSARIVVTMGMPAFAYRWWFGAHGSRAFKRSMLGFCGIAPIRETRVGMVGSERARANALREMERLGKRAL